MEASHSDCSPRRRVLDALAHREPDRVPLDIGGTYTTGINIGAYERLKAHLGIPGPARMLSRRSLIADVEEPVFARLGSDCRPVLHGSPWSQEPQGAPGGTETYRDEWGVVRTRPAGGHWIETEHPLAGEVTLSDLDRFPWPDPDDAGYVRSVAERCRSLHEESGYCVILCLPVGVVHQCQFLRGYQQWMEDLVLEPEFAEALIGRVCDLWVRVAENLLAAAGANADVLMWGDDIAFQNGPMLSDQMYRRFIRPAHARIMAALKRSGAPVLYHSCGSVLSRIPDLIEMGVDALNPVQVAAAGMDTARLKREFGRHLTFWGAVDTQRVLPQGTPEDVRAEVRRRIEDLGAGGGYVVAAVHNLQREVPPENILALADAVLS